MRGAITLLALIVFAALPASAAAAKPRTWDARLFKSSDGSNIRFSTIAQDGAAAGGKFFPDGSSHALYFNGRRLRDFSSRLGPISSFTSLNDRHQAVGYASSNPAARLANLFGANPDPSIMPRAFFMSGNVLRRLTVPSAAFGVNASGEVAGTFRAKDGRLHAFLWRPRERAGGARASARRRTRAFVDLGVGDARALSDPDGRPRRRRGASAAAVPRGVLTVVGGNAIWFVNPITNAIVRRVVASNLFLQSVSNNGLASGGEDHPDGSRSPVIFDVNRGVLRMPNIPPGLGSGFAASVSRSTGLASGSVGSGSDQHGELWTTGGSIVGDPNTLPGVSLPPGTKITNTPAVADTGLMAGFATTPTGQQEGVVVAPSPYTKRPLLLKALDVYVDTWGSGGSGARVRRVRAGINDSFQHWNGNRPKTACNELKDTAADLLKITRSNFQEAFDGWYEHAVARERAEALARPALAVELRAALVEFGGEIDCPGMKRALGLE